MRGIFLYLTLSLLTGSHPATRSFIADDKELNFSDRGKTIENSIRLYISDEGFETLKLNNGVKVSFENILTIINGDTLSSRSVGTHGGSTLLFRRKSFTFSLNSKASFHHGENVEQLRKFYALSLSMDRDYICNRLAYEMLEKINLFGLFYSFGEIHINDSTGGICMIVERPDDWALRKINSPFIMRRGYNEIIDKMECSETGDKKETGSYSRYFSHIYKSLKKYNGEELYRTLSQWIDLDNYMRWLALNYLVRNGDYTDEVFFYIDPEIKRFRIIPWDYDDLFLPAPHEGIKERRKVLGNKLIFSSEDKLDLKIATDPYLYKIYLTHLAEILDQLTDRTLREIFENTYSELYPYYTNKEIIGMSRYDSHRETCLSNLENDMRLLFDQLKMSYQYYRDYLKSEN